jgi:hypothetical protein
MVDAPYTTSRGREYQAVRRHDQEGQYFVLEEQSPAGAYRRQWGPFDTKGQASLWWATVPKCAECGDPMPTSLNATHPYPCHLDAD